MRDIRIALVWVRAASSCWVTPSSRRRVLRSRAMASAGLAGAFGAGPPGTRSLPFWRATGARLSEERLALSRAPLTRIAHHDLESKPSSRCTRACASASHSCRAGAEHRRGVNDRERVPVFALEATASHIVDLYEVTANRMVRAARARRRRRVPDPCELATSRFQHQSKGVCSGQPSCGRDVPLIEIT